MDLKKRILACIILIILLAVLCIFGYAQQEAAPTLGKALEGEDSKNWAVW